VSNFLNPCRLSLVYRTGSDRIDRLGEKIRGRVLSKSINKIFLEPEGIKWLRSEGPRPRQKLICSKPDSIQPEVHRHLDIGDNGFRSTHRWFEFPILQGLQGGFVHRTRGGTDQLNVPD